METQKQETAKTKPTPNVAAAAAGNTKATTPAVVKPTTTALAVTEEFSEGGWDTEVVDTKDILIPKILLMHPTSDLVKKGVRNQGDIIKSTTGEVLAKRNESFDVLVFEKWKEWKIEKKNPQSGRYEYVRIDPWTPENDSLEWDYTEGNDIFRRNKTMNFYGLIAKEAQEGSAFPVRLSFVRTGFKTGLKIADCYARALMEKQPPTRQVFKIGAELVQGKEETFFAFTAQPGESSTPEMKAAALQWRKVIHQAKKNNAIVDHEVDNDEAVSHATTTDF